MSKKKTLTNRDKAEAWAVGLISIGVPGGWMVIIEDRTTRVDYPLYVWPEEDIQDIIRGYKRGGAEEVIGVYNLGLPLEPQFNETHPYNYLGRE